ncbi:MAG: alpha/beta hydrolase-fold protein, partial [Verrucomicrobia bacterium]|nr:alpha/beta hydrolase-fold protein [Verrucomicrobiota bacterium]
RATLSMMLFAAIAVLGAEPPTSLPPASSAPARANVGQPVDRRPLPKGAWLDPDHSAPNGTQYQTFPSKVLGREASYLVWLPPGYEQQKKRYPVVYWLHGMGGNQRAGATIFVPQVAAAIKDGVLPPAIVVLVNGMVKSFYCDASDGQCPMESVIIKDLVPHVDETYRTLARREGRVIEGYSMGGSGAGHLGFKYPELFGTVVINAGALLDPSLMNIPKDGPMFAVFGTDNERRLAEHPRTLARRNADKLRGKTRIRIGCGSLDNLLPRNQDLHEQLTQLGIQHEFTIVPDVAHNSLLFYRKLGTNTFEFHRKSLEAQDKIK